jgi:hypothetical protein
VANNSSMAHVVINNIFVFNFYATLSMGIVSASIDVYILFTLLGLVLTDCNKYPSISMTTAIHFMIVGS